jgi:hypothetical protein
VEKRPKDVQAYTTESLCFDFVHFAYRNYKRGKEITSSSFELKFLIVMYRGQNSSE